MSVINRDITLLFNNKYKVIFYEGEQVEVSQIVPYKNGYSIKVSNFTTAPGQEGRYQFFHQKTEEQAMELRKKLLNLYSNRSTTKYVEYNEEQSSEESSNQSPKIGRPRKYVSKQDHKLSFYVTEEEYNIFIKEVEEHGATVSSYLRRKVLR